MRILGGGKAHSDGFDPTVLIMVGISGCSLPCRVYSRYVKSLRRKTALGEQRQSLISSMVNWSADRSRILVVAGPGGNLRVWVADSLKRKSSSSTA